MGRGDLAKVRNSKDRQREKKARDKRQAAERGSGAEGREEEVAPPRAQALPFSSHGVSLVRMCQSRELGVDL